jgi:hypothetical protein
MFVLGVCILSAVLWAVSKTKIYDYFYIILLWVFIGLYIQGNYIPRNYGLLDGSTIEWEQYTKYAVASLVIIGMVILGIVITCIKGRNIALKIGSWIFSFVTAMLLVTLVTLSIKNFDTVTSLTDEQYVVTEKSMLSLSEEKNIVVILLDQFGSDVFLEMLESEEGDEIREKLVDFTYYPDTVGAYPVTPTSLAYILTGEWYENQEKYDDYVKNAYSKTTLYSTLQEQGYDVGVYTNRSYLDSSNDYNTYVNVGQGRYKVSNYKHFVADIYKLVAFNYVPHQLKKYFVIYTDDLNKWRTLKSKDGENVYTQSTVDFYDNLVKERISIDNSVYSFRFYHLDGVHGPHTFGKDLKSDTQESYTRYDEGLGCVTVVNEYMNQLKELGVYENTAVVVMADHSYNREYTLGRNPIFMVKNFGETHEFEVSDKQLSYEDLQATFISLATDEVMPNSIWSEEIDNRTERRFLWYDNGTYQVDGFVPDTWEYMVTEPAYEPDSMTPTKKIYITGGGIRYDE